MNLAEQIAEALKRARERKDRRQVELNARAKQQRTIEEGTATPTPSRKKLEWE
jgi:hypothetical protein